MAMFDGATGEVPACPAHADGPMFLVVTLVPGVVPLSGQKKKDSQNRWRWKAMVMPTR